MSTIIGFAIFIAIFVFIYRMVASNKRRSLNMFNEDAYIKSDSRGIGYKKVIPDEVD